MPVTRWQPWPTDLCEQVGVDMNPPAYATQSVLIPIATLAQKPSTIREKEFKFLSLRTKSHPKQ